MDNIIRTATICVSTCLTYYPSFSRIKKKLNEKFSARRLLYCCCFLGNIPETEDENLRKPLKHTILILHSTLSTSFYFWGGCAYDCECIHIMTIIHWAEWRKKMKNSSGNYVCQSEEQNDGDMKGNFFFYISELCTKRLCCRC